MTATRPRPPRGAPPAGAPPAGAPSPALLAEVSAFLAAEAHLLDDRAYDDWLALFTAGCLYWMPVDPTAADGALRLNVVYDDRARLADRIARLTSGQAHTEDPPALTARSVASVHLDAGSGAAADPFVVRSSFVLVAHRAGDQRVLAGRCTHRLVRHDGGLLIAEKRVGLLGSDAPQRPMTFLF